MLNACIFCFLNVLTALPITYSFFMGKLKQEIDKDHDELAKDKTDKTKKKVDELLLQHKVELFSECQDKMIESPEKDVSTLLNSIFYLVLQSLIWTFGNRSVLGVQKVDDKSVQNRTSCRLKIILIKCPDLLNSA